MPSDTLLYAGILFAGGLLVPGKALVLYRATGGRTPDPDARSATKVRVVSALLVLVAVLDAARVLS